MHATLKVRGSSGNKDAEFLSYDEYQDIALKCINYLWTRKKISERNYRIIVNSDENVSYVVYSVMRADWLFRKDAKAELSSYRMQHVKWCIYSIIKDVSDGDNYNLKKFSELATENNEGELEDFIPIATRPDNEDKDIYNFIIEEAQEVLSEELLPIFMFRFYHGWSISKIARKYEKTIPQINGLLRKAISSIKSSGRIRNAIGR